MTTMSDKWFKISICQCCLIITANGEACATEDCQSCQQYDRLGNERYHLTASWYDCPSDGSHDDGCACGEGYFSWGSCEWCNVPQGGQRYDVWAEER